MAASTSGPPRLMEPDDPAAAEPARRRLQSSRLRLFSSLPSLRSRSSQPRPRSQLSFLHPSQDSHNQHPALRSSNSLPIALDDANVHPLGNTKDVYRWAALYENQRGITLFSSPYYSPLSLLPTDPLPFTIPLNNAKRSHQPDISLKNYPLPDGTWQWVSKSWMIDMRTDSGEVQHDGFEYNWRFRDNNWRAEAGKLGTGAWVRRRRWVRLMVRPARHPRDHGDGQDNMTFRNSPSESASSAVSLVHPGSELALDEMDSVAREVWKGDDQDWVRLHRCLKRLGRDGRKIEAWRKWLGVSPEKIANNSRIKQWSEDEAPLPSEIALRNLLRDPEKGIVLQHISPVLQEHGDSILQSFVFPDTRAQFLELLNIVGLLEALLMSLPPSGYHAVVDFWSYVSDLHETHERDAAVLAPAGSNITVTATSDPFSSQEGI